jgi:L-ectoine synthase
MKIITKEDVAGSPFHVDWGNGDSYRLLTARDQMGFGVCYTVVRAGSESLLEYRNHLEACYCLSGEGEVEDMAGNIHMIRPGVLYVLDEHDKHYLRGGKSGDLILLSIFNPPLQGHERHSLSADSGSAY